MQGAPRLFIDRFSEVWSLLEPWATEGFWNFDQAAQQAGAVYVVGRQNYLDHTARFRHMAESGQYRMIFCNAAEGSWTLDSQLRQLRLDHMIQQGRVLLIGGAELSSQYPCLCLDHFLTRIMDFPGNRSAQAHTAAIFESKPKPFDYVFLNGRARPHRKYLYERLLRRGLLDRALYTMLDAKPCQTPYFHFQEHGINIMATVTPLRRLPDEYEVVRYRNPVFGPITDTTNLKQELFRQQWGEIYLEPSVYTHSYFSLVTETVCAESDISFRTEKIAKPLAMGHPFIVAANKGFLRDLRAQGFRTFGTVFDESYDTIDDVQQRMDRIIDLVQDLCGQDLDQFVAACQDVCKYNQLHLDEFTERTRREFPSRFFQFIGQHG